MEFQEHHESLQSDQLHLNQEKVGAN